MRFHISLKPLRECIDKYGLEMQSRDWSKASLDLLNDIVGRGKQRMLGSLDKIDVGRAVIWFANGELARRGVAPRYRACLPAVARIPATLLQAVNKADAPYIDLQWLASHYPDHQLPTRLKGLVKIAEWPVPFSFPAGADTKGYSRDAMGRAEKIVMGRGSLTRKVKHLGLTRIQQIGMRIYCGKAVHERISELNVWGGDIMGLIQAQKLPQLRNNPLLVTRRVDYWKAWKLAGGNTQWQDAADVFNFMYGSTVSRQAVRDIIMRMKEQKIIRRKGRKMVKKAVLK